MPLSSYGVKEEIGYYDVSGRQSDTTFIKSGAGWYGGILIGTNGINDVTVTIYDSIVASGKILDEFTIAGGDNYGGSREPLPTRFVNGLTVVASGTGNFYTVRYR